jgi:site-specific DNA-methyltransferase (adenine-specific)
MTNGFYSQPVAMSSLTDDWATPQTFYDTLAKEFKFQLDAAAAANNNKTQLWYGLDHPDPTRRDGLSASRLSDVGRGGWVFMNPPYGKTIGLWMRKASEENRLGVKVVSLVPARTDTAWFQDYAIGHELRFVRGRLKFGQSKNSAPFPSCVVVMR